MRNKVFAIVFSIIFLFMLVGAPAVRFLTDRGVLEYNNVGNIIEADKTYDEGTAFGRFFTKIENAKVYIKDTYINKLPFFLEITNFYKPFKNSLNRPMIDGLQRLGVAKTRFVCKHVYVEEVILPDCENDGYTLKTCKLCSEAIKENPVKATGHVFTAIESVTPTCEGDGYTVYRCDVCLALEQSERVEAKGHDYETLSETLPTCTEGGFAEYKCLVCQALHTEELAPLGHSYEAEGNVNVCKLCGDSYIDVGEHSHKYVTVTVAPTCVKGGYDEHVCELCRNTYRSNNTLPLGHKYVSSIVAPTCTERGYTERVCENCSDSVKADYKDALGHTFQVKTVAPSYTDEGYDLYTCKSCTHSYKDNIVPMLENIIPEPKTTPDAKNTTYSASLVTTDNIFRHYAITASFPDGTSKTTYSRIVKLDRDTLHSNMLNVAGLINAMVKKDSKVNWYMSFATNIEATEIGERILPQESTRYVYEDFLTKIDPSVKVSAVKVNSFNDYYDKFYITDHHWNHHGSEEAYLGIVKMLRENYADIEPIEVEKLYEFTGVRFYGSLSRSSAEYDVSDIFGLYYRRLPSHNVIHDDKIKYGSDFDIDVNLSIYVDEMYETRKGYNHYTEFYRVCKEISYPENKTGRNLLLIGDSYSLPLLELVAAHFDNTYIRYEDRSWNNFPDELYYDEFIKEKNITDVLVIEEMAKCVMQGYGDAYPSGFLNIFPDREW